MQNSAILSQFNMAQQINAEPWPTDATLYQPFEDGQILLPENASCLAVKTYLKMCKLPFEVHSCKNAEFMSPGGRMTKLPFLRVGAFIYSEFEPIVNFLEQKGVALGKRMHEDDKSDMRTYVSLVENIFSMAEMYMCFVNNRNYNEVTVERNGSPYPWPLNLLQNYAKRRNALRLLKVYKWHDMTTEEVIDKVSKCCETLTLKLNESESPFFYSDEPCDLDAVAFGHLYSIITTKLPDDSLAQTVKRYPRLTEFCEFIENTYYQLN